MAAFLSVLGSIWLITEIITRVSSKANTLLDENGTTYLGVAATCAIIAFLITIFEARKVAFTIPNTDTTLTLKFGSIFDENADWIIGVNEFFDSQLGTIVSSSSLHGQIISNVYGGDESSFRRDVDAALSNVRGRDTNRAQGQKTKYPLGTTIDIPRGARKIFLVAIAKTDTETHRASSSIPILWDALSKAIEAIDKRGNGEPLAMPLLGNGRASLNIPPQHLLRILTLRLTELGKTFDLPRKITLNLADDCFEHLDLVEIKKGWSLV